jgi:hypothetical protein
MSFQQLVSVIKYVAYRLATIIVAAAATTTTIFQIHHQ